MRNIYIPFINQKKLLMGLTIFGYETKHASTCIKPMLRLLNIAFILISASLKHLSIFLAKIQSQPFLCFIIWIQTHRIKLLFYERTMQSDSLVINNKFGQEFNQSLLLHV